MFLISDQRSGRVFVLLVWVWTPGQLTVTGSNQVRVRVSFVRVKNTRTCFRWFQEHLLRLVSLLFILTEQATIFYKILFS